MTLFPRIIETLGARQASDVLIFAGGIIPERDIAELKRAGIAEIFTPGAPLGDITRWLEQALDQREAASR
jgi:methylmalonyl-CoA mutase C-terminal domain/subunit